MATKTISIDLEAHRRLSAARRSSKESFSKVIHRASWERERPATGARLLSLMQEIGPADPEVIEALETAQREDKPPKDPWEK